jgi:endogenous inhibitor of DNA gyrase (YacG/DUF329 family)
MTINRMTLESVYCVECVCGQHIESETNTLTCPRCQRLVLIEWSAGEEEHEESSAAAQTPAAA